MHLSQDAASGTRASGGERQAPEASHQRPASPSQPVPKRALPSDSRHQGSPSGQGTSRQMPVGGSPGGQVGSRQAPLGGSPSGQGSLRPVPLGSSPQGSSPGQGFFRQGSSGQAARRQADRRPVSERGSLEVPSHYQVCSSAAESAWCKIICQQHVLMRVSGVHTLSSFVSSMVWSSVCVCHITEGLHQGTMHLSTFSNA